MPSPQLVLDRRRLQAPRGEQDVAVEPQVRELLDEPLVGLGDGGKGCLDAFLPDLATSVSVMSDAFAALDRNEEAAKAAVEALQLLAPSVERYPDHYGGLARTIGADIIRYSEAAGMEPDLALLERVARALTIVEPGA